ncbi:MAG TPA: WD40 repeat domain-containing protein [Gemmataceae bacterium]|nr:WD40 repeat domain-containing protein [Gemmataceae bacterium]
MISFDAWKDGRVSPTKHTVKVIEPKPGPKPEPVSKRFIKTLVHPDRSADVSDVRFFAGGSKLFATGYPSGILQVFEISSGKEISRIQSPPGYRGTSEYALVTPDWQTVYVPTERRKVVSFEKDGLKQRRIEYDGELLAWNLADGKQLAALKPSAPDRSVLVGYISPTGDKLITVERPGFNVKEDMPNETELWDLKTRTATALGSGYGMAAFSGDGRRVAVTLFGTTKQDGRMVVTDIPSGRVLFTAKPASKGRGVSWPKFSPDGKTLAVEDSPGRIDQPATLRLYNVEDGKEFAAFHTEGRYPFRDFAFSPDSRRLVAVDYQRKLWVWDAVTGKVERTYVLAGLKFANHISFSPDNKWLAVLGQPEWNEAEVGRDPDPADLPQPRVFLFQMGRSNSPEVVICPYGYCGGLAFSPDGKTLAVGGAGGVHLFALVP